MYFIELIATRKCNQNCYYCTTKQSDSVEVDLDFVRWALDLLPETAGVELTGGEIGLLNNLNEFYEIVKGHPKIKHIMVLSNGLLRQNGVVWLDEVEYWEHMIWDIVDKEIIKFYPMGLDGSHKYIIVMTKRTTKSLVDNWDYFKDIGLFRDNFFYKMMNHKSDETISSYVDDLSTFYKRMDNQYYKRMLISYQLDGYLKSERLLCQKYSPNPFIDIQRRELGHCAINVNVSVKVPFSEQNLHKLMRGELSENDYCKSCHSFDNGKDREWNRNRSYEQ